MLISVVNVINMLGGLWSRFDYPETTPPLQNGRNARNLELSLPAPFVQTELGGYEGYFMRVLGGREIYAFEGVHFAEPPERFKAPIKKKPFYGNYSAKSVTPECVQTYYGTVVKPTGIFFGKEDCLTCNIYSAMISSNGNYPDLPVIINFFGGVYSVGSSNDYGPAYLLEKDMILVNCNYRVGVFGFLSTGDSIASGNWALKDAAMAVDWVHSYIRSFGGDPRKIVLYGQSAGAALSHLLLLSPAHLKLEEKIAGVIASSGGALNAWSLEDPSFAIKMTKRFASMNFCPTNMGNQVMVDCLRKRNPYVLNAVSNLLHISEDSIMEFRPVIEPNVEGAFITDTAENIYMKKKVAKVPLIMSQNSQDTDLILLGLRTVLFQVQPADLTPLILHFAPILLEYKNRVQGREKKVTEKIVEFYGSRNYFRKNPRSLFKIAQDRMFTCGLLKALKLHSKVAPTYGMIFGYKSPRGIAGIFRQDFNEYGTPHAEEILYMFNRTDIPSIKKDDKDYEIVKLFQSLFINFANTGTLKYTSEDNELIDKVNPVDPKNNKFEMFVIQDKSKVVEMELVNNITVFWESLGIIRYPSLLL